MKSRKYKIDPLHALLVLIACIFAFGPLYLSYRKRTNFTPQKLNWIEIDMPGVMQGQGWRKDTGVKFLASTDGSTVAVVTLVPAGPESEALQASKEGALEVAQFFSRLFPEPELSEVNCAMDLRSKTYKITARRAGDRWHVRGLVKFFPKHEYAVALMCSSRLGSDAAYALSRMYRSLNLPLLKVDPLEQLAPPEEPAR